MNWLAVEAIVRAALNEDLGHGDITSELTPGAERQVTGRFIARQPGVICGTRVAALAFHLLDPDSETMWNLKDGDECQAGQEFGVVRGTGGLMLSAERVALNFLQRLCGIATLARRWAKLAAPPGIHIVETRKTTPGLRTLEKYAVKTGGGFNHRLDLDHAVMLKDNHFALARLAGIGPSELVSLAKQKVSHMMLVNAEADDLTMVEPLTAAGADVVCLDNFTPEMVREAVGIVAGRAAIEISGGVNESNLADYLIPGVTVISIGALTHSYKSLDISLELDAG